MAAQFVRELVKGFRRRQAPNPAAGLMMHFYVTPRSAYLRDQADKCRRHANAQSDHETQAELRKLG